MIDVHLTCLTKHKCKKGLWLCEVTITQKTAVSSKLRGNLCSTEVLSEQINCCLAGSGFVYVMLKTVGQQNFFHSSARTGLYRKTPVYRTTHITLPCTVHWSPGIQRALWRSTVVAVVAHRSCVALLSPWRRLCRRSCGHQGRGRMVYCMAGTRPLRTQEGSKAYCRFDTTCDFYCCSSTNLTSDAWRQRELYKPPLLLTSAEWPCQHAMPGRATERTLSLTHGLAATSLMRG